MRKYFWNTLGDKWKSERESHSVVSDSLWPHGLYSPWNSPGQNTGVDSLSLLQGIFPTQGLNPGLPHCRQILYQMSHNGSHKEIKEDQKTVCSTILILWHIWKILMRRYSWWFYQKVEIVNELFIVPLFFVVELFSYID